MSLTWSDVDWGNAPSWVAVLAAITAAIFAGRNVLVDVHDRRQRQAEQIAAWSDSTQAGQRLGVPWHESKAWVRNASSLPAYDVEVVWTLHDVIWRAHEIRALPPADEPTFIRLPRVEEFGRIRPWPTPHPTRRLRRAAMSPTRDWTSASASGTPQAGPGTAP